MRFKGEIKEEPSGRIEVLKNPKGGVIIKLEGRSMELNESESLDLSARIRAVLLGWAN